jgi:hypothetical protein
MARDVHAFDIPLFWGEWRAAGFSVGEACKIEPTGRVVDGSASEVERRSEHIIRRAAKPGEGSARREGADLVRERGFAERNGAARTVP